MLSLLSGLLMLFGALPARADERAHVVQLSEPLPLGHVGDVGSLQVTADGRWVVFLADATVDERFELYSVPTDGSAAPRTLSEPLVAEFDVLDFRLSPDGETVVYRLGMRDGTRVELFSVPSDGSAPPVRLHEPHGGNGFVLLAEISPDSRRVLFFGDLRERGSFELFSVPSDGSAPPVPLHPPVSGGAASAGFTPDSSQVVFWLLDLGSWRLHLAPSDGGALRDLSGPLERTGSGKSFRVTPDGRRVVYVAEPLGQARLELFSVPLDGSASAQVLNPPLASGGTLDGVFELDSSGTRAVYRMRPSSTSQTELHSVPVDGSPADVRLDAAISPGVFGTLRMTSAGRVLFEARPSSAVNNAVFSVPADGSALPVRLGNAPTASSVHFFEPTRDGRHVVFIRHLSSRVDLFLAAADGSSPEVRLDLPPFDLVSMFGVRLDATHVFLVGRRVDTGPFELFAAPLDASTGLVRLLAAQPPLREPSFDLAVAGGAAFVRTAWSEGGVQELVRVPVDVAEPPRSLSGTGALTTVGDVQRFELAGREVVYQAQDLAQRMGLFLVDLDRGGSPRRLDDARAYAAGDGVVDFELAPEKDALVYRASLAGIHGLFLVPHDDSLSPRRLDPPSPFAPGVLAHYRFTPDGRWILYVSKGSNGGLSTLYVVPRDGSAAARAVVRFSLRITSDFRLDASSDSRRVVLCPNLDDIFTRTIYSALITDPSAGVESLFVGNSADITAMAIAPDSERLVLRADAVADDRFLLYSWPLDGSTGPVALIPPLSGGGLDFDFGAGGRVVFRSNQPGERIELASAPVDGSAPPVKLQALPPGRLVRDFVVAPDGGRVLYRADAITDDRYELFSVPSDGSAPAVRLSYASRQDTDVPAYAFTPDSRLVLFLADTLRNEQDDLYVVPADRSAAPRRLNPSLAPHGTLFDFACSPDGEFVAYRANHRERAVAELFRVPLAGGVGPVQLSAPLVFGGDVRRYAFVTSGELVYDADQLEDNVHELFASFLGERRRPSAPPRPLR